MTRYVLRSTTADALPLYIGEGGPTILRESALEVPADEIERRRAWSEYVFGMKLEAVPAS